MCGIAGFWDARPATREHVDERLERMCATLVHRGPDDEGTWWNGRGGPALGFRRLAILDLSPAGHQPMTSRSGRYTIVFNGEIYNHRDIRATLAAEGWRFLGSSDTEVILAAAEQWGLARLWERLWGMFAIALWDEETQRLHLVRDRLGKKPLYYGRCDRVLLFGSELKALRAHRDFSPTIDRSALTAFTRFGYVPGDRAIYAGVHKVPPGCAVVFAHPLKEPTVETYWSARDVMRQRIATRPASVDVEGATDECEALLSDAVSRRMVADVPLGAFLSGGIDSSLITALMATAGRGRVRTFTIGFDEQGYDEAQAARAVAKVLGTDHVELRLTHEQTREIIPRLPWIYDEPFADVSQIPTYLVAALARRHVTVALSGDGGDEVFGGYVRHQFLPAAMRSASRVPAWARQGIAAGLQLPSPATWNRAYGVVRGLLPSRVHQARPGEKIHKLASALACRSFSEAYLRTVSVWQSPRELVLESTDDRLPWDDAQVAEMFPDALDRVMALDMLTYLPDDILVKVDRASMAVGLEARAPLLDHRVVEWAWRQPQALKIADGRGKWLLRRVLARHVPPELFERPKMGFAVPVGTWLRGPLREWADTLLDERRIRAEAFFSPAIVSRVWADHLAGRGTHEHRLWAILMFQTWLESTRQ